MEPFHYPPTRLLGWILTVSLCSVLVSWTNMRDVLVLLDDLLRFLSNVGRIQTQMLRRCLAWLWAGNHDGIQGWSNESSVMNVCPIYRDGEGQSMSLT